MLYVRSKITGQDGIQINGANDIKLIKNQKKEDREIILDIKKYPFLKKTRQSFLMKNLIRKCGRIAFFSAQ
jgi:hypothetical protein